MKKVPLQQRTLVKEQPTRLVLDVAQQLHQSFLPLVSTPPVVAPTVENETVATVCAPEALKRILVAASSSQNDEKAEKWLPSFGSMNKKKHTIFDSSEIHDLFHIEPLTGGNSNLVYTVKQRADHDTSVIVVDKEKDIASNSHTVGDEEEATTATKTFLLRCYGAGSSAFVDHEKEAEIARTLSSEKHGHLGPMIFKSFPWGRLEEFIPKANCMNTQTLLRANDPTFLRDETLALKKMHCIPAHTLKCFSMGCVPASQDQEPSSRDWGTVLTKPEASALFKTCDTFLRILSERRDALRRKVSGEEENDDQPSSLDEALKVLQSETDSFLHGLFLECHDCHRQTSLSMCGGDEHGGPSTTASSSPLYLMSLCHNDLNPQNVLWTADADETSQDQNERTVYLIDFEFAGVNFIAFDLGNMLCEMDFDLVAEAENEAKEESADPLPAEDDKNTATIGTTVKDSEAAGFAILHPREPYKVAPNPHDKRSMRIAPKANLASALAHEHIERKRRKDNVQGLLQQTTNNMLPPEVGSRCLMASARHIYSHCLIPYFSVDGSASALADEAILRLLCGMAASHLLWSLWGIVMATTKKGGKSTPTADHPHEKKVTPQTPPPQESSFVSGEGGLDCMKYSQFRLEEYLLVRQVIEQMRDVLNTTEHN